eukprot:334640-Amorphochlora_amoeboformis.AAC.2
MSSSGTPIGSPERRRTISGLFRVRFSSVLDAKDSVAVFWRAHRGEGARRAVRSHAHAGPMLIKTKEDSQNHQNPQIFCNFIIFRWDYG